MTRFVFSTVFMLIISLFTSVNIYAQHAKCTISGKLVDEQATSIAYASIALYDEEKPVAGVVTDNEGRFTLMLNQSDKKFKLVVQYIGYARYEMPLTPNKHA
ncbi:MAG: carboxypeptidase-like regulatory domain-containing protein [Bacteroidaceae bacterium]|nr:carboxypeptidase-like regulatory domain-containing protein [Bacteroidaceae bacterium]